MKNWFKNNELLYFTIISCIVLYNGFVLEIFSIDFELAKQERSLFKIQYVKNDYLLIHLCYFEINIWEKNKIK